jgi:hypothetical protein
MGSPSSRLVGPELSQQQQLLRDWWCTVSAGRKRFRLCRPDEWALFLLSATGTDYFAACYAHHIPPDSDLVFLEGAVNDMVM